MLNFKGISISMRAITKVNFHHNDNCRRFFYFTKTEVCSSVLMSEIHIVQPFKEEIGYI